MRTLVWDTSSRVGAIAALEWQPKGSLKLIAEWTLSVEATHSERLLWAIHQVLEAARWKVRDVDVFGVGVGPGSFTGLRIGLTTARTLAHTLKRPLIGVSSLAALARPAAGWLAQTQGRSVVVAATDAAKGEWFSLWGSARSVCDCVVRAEGDAAGIWKRGVEEKVLPPEELVAEVKRKLAQGGGAEGWLALGEAVDRRPEVWKKLPARARIELPTGASHHVQGRYLGQLVWEAYQGGVLRQALDVKPRYLRDSDAEVKLRAGLLPPGPTRGK